MLVIFNHSIRIFRVKARWESEITGYIWNCCFLSFLVFAANSESTCRKLFRYYAVKERKKKKSSLIGGNTLFLLQLQWFSVRTCMASHAMCNFIYLFKGMKETFLFFCVCRNVCEYTCVCMCIHVCIYICVCVHVCLVCYLLHSIVYRLLWIFGSVLSATLFSPFSKDK